MIAKYIKELDDGQIKNEKLILDDVTNIIKSNPNLYSAYILRGRVYAKQKLYQQALEDFNKSIQINSKNCEGYLQRAKVLEEMKKIEDAISDYGKAIDCDSKNMIGYMKRGLLQYEMKQLNNALIDFSKVITLDPKHADAYFSRGVIFKQLNKLDDAINDYTKSISLNPNNANTYYNRGNAFQEYHKFNDAIGDYTKAIELNPKKAKIYYNRGVVYKQQNKFDDAIRDYTKAIQLDPYKANAYYTRAIAFRELNKFDDAIKDYQKAVDIQPNHPLFLSNIGQYYLSNNQPDKAHKYIKKALDVLNNTDQQKLTLQFNINQGNIQYVLKSVKLLELIENKLQQIQSNNTQRNQNLQLIKTVQDGLNKNQSDEKSKTLQLENVIKQLQELKQEVAQIKQNDIISINNKLKSLEEPQNKNKYLYYQSFCPRILAYIEACILLETGFFQANTNVVMENIAEKMIDKMNQAAKVFGTAIGFVPIVGAAIEKLFDLFDFGVQCYKERKFSEKLSKIMSVIKSRIGTQFQREQQFQLATFDILDLITEDDLNIQNLKYYDSVQKIIVIEQTSNKNAQNEYWQLGVYHCIIVLKYIEKESKFLLANEQLNLRNIVLQSFKKQQKIIQKDKNSSE